MPKFSDRFEDWLEWKAATFEVCLGNEFLEIIVNRFNAEVYKPPMEMGLSLQQIVMFPPLHAYDGAGGKMHMTHPRYSIVLYMN